MKKTTGMIIALGLILNGTFAEASGSNRAFSPVNIASTESCLILKMDGERVPFPLQKANTKFALADGETYLLNGTLTILSGKVFLDVDLESQPWLATASVIANPYFEVDAMDAGSIHHYSGKFVQMAVVANREVGTSAGEAPAMRLSSILPPAVTTK
jgi:hypothetical protein